jgi:hypothetical protein
MSGIFISYRREDSAAHAGRLYDRLSTRFGADRVFLGVDDIRPGAAFTGEIESQVAASDAMIVVIGKDWLTSRNARGELRLHDPDDLVRLEVASALRRRLLIIPVLVGGARMPKPEELPVQLKGLAGRNAVHIDRDFQRDTESLIGPLEKRLNANTPAAKTAREAERAELRRKLLRRLVWKVPIILLLVSLALWWEWRKQPATVSVSSPVNTGVTGLWSGVVVYPWNAKHMEEFFFQPEGAKLFGTASFLELKRGIEEGRVDADNISFYVRYDEVSGGERRERKNYYWGRVSGDRIVMRMQDDRGSVPVEWTLTRDEGSR